MAAAFSSRAATVLLTLLGPCALVAHAEDRVQLLPTEIPADPSLLTGDADHNKLVLTAGTRPSDKPESAAPRVHVVVDGSSSRWAKRAAIEALGLSRLPWQNQQLVEGIVDEVSIFRRLPAYRSEVDPRVHDFFTHHPDVAVSMWRAMGISQLQMWKTGDWSYGMDTKDGTTGTINVLYRSRTSCLIVCSGMFKSPYLQNPIAAKSLMHLRTRFVNDPSGRTFATHQADLFVAFPSQKVETVAKLISPLSNVIIDRNFQEISLFIHVMGIAMGRQPGWVEQIAGSLGGIEEARRKQLIKLTAEVYVDTQTALQTRSGKAVSLDTIRPPIQGRQTQTRRVFAVQAADGETGSTQR